MKRKNRLSAGIVIFCFMLCSFTPFRVYAAEGGNTSSGQTSVQQKVADKTSSQASSDQAGQTGGNVAGVVAEQPDGEAAGQASGTAGQATRTTTGQAIEADGPEDGNDESLWYSKKIPMKKEHQKLLWDYCKKRKLDYIDMLSLIYTESNFYEKCRTSKYYGYFQISKGNCAELAKTLKTGNTPLDGAININWGTAMYSWILADKRVKGLEGKKLRDVALSIYQRGTVGYDKLGISKSFLKTFYKKRSIVCSYFGIDP